MIKNKRVEKVHRALSAYLRPRLRAGASEGIEFLSAFDGATDENIDRRIPTIVNDVMRLTQNELAMDASATELHARMRAALHPEEGISDMNDDLVKRILAFLQPKLTPDELRHVYALLMEPSPAAAKSDAKKGRHNPDGTPITPDYAEDAKARAAFDQRYPSASRIRIEPNFAPERQQHATPDAEGFFKRFPDAQRIKQAL